MVWFRVDDNFHSHPKVMKAGTSAVGLWARCGSYCSHHRTDGVVPVEVARAYGTTAQIKALLDAGLWVQSDSGYTMPDFLDFNPSREEIERDESVKHEAKVRAGQAGGIASGIARRKHSTKQTRSRAEAEVKQNEAPSRTRTQTPSLVPSGELVPLRSGAENSAEAVVAAFMSAAADAGMSPPGERTRNKVGRTALSMLHDGAEIRTLVAAARSLATKPYDDLEREVRILETSHRAPTAPPRIAHTNSVLRSAYERASEAEGNTG